MDPRQYVWRGRPHRSLPHIRLATFTPDKPHRTFSNQAAVEVMRKSFDGNLKAERIRTKSNPRVPSRVWPNSGGIEIFSIDGTTESSQRKGEPVQKKPTPPSVPSSESYEEDWDSYYSSSLASENSVGDEVYASRHRRHPNTALAKEFLPAVSDRLAAELPRREVDTEPEVEKSSTQRRGRHRIRSILKFCLPSRQENSSGPLPPAQPVRFPLTPSVGESRAPRPDQKRDSQMAKAKSERSAPAAPLEPRYPANANRSPTRTQPHGSGPRSRTPSMMTSGGVVYGGKVAARSSKDRLHELAVAELDRRLETLEEASESSVSRRKMMLRKQYEQAILPPKSEPEAVKENVKGRKPKTTDHRKKKIVQMTSEQATLSPTLEPGDESVQATGAATPRTYGNPRSTDLRDLDQNEEPAEVAFGNEGTRRRVSVATKREPPVFRIDYGTPPPRRLAEGDYQPVPTPSPPSTVSRIYKHYEDGHSSVHSSPGVSREPTRRAPPAPPAISHTQSFGTLQESPSSLTLHTNEDSAHSPGSPTEAYARDRTIRAGAMKIVVETHQTTRGVKKSAAATFLQSPCGLETPDIPPKSRSRKTSTVARPAAKATSSGAETISRRPNTDGQSSTRALKERNRRTAVIEVAESPSGSHIKHEDGIDWTKKHLWAKAVVAREEMERDQVMRRRAEMGWG